MDEDQEVIAVIRRQNRALRKVNKVLRKALKANQEYSDELFVELCNTLPNEQDLQQMPE